MDILDSMAARLAVGLVGFAGIVLVLIAKRYRKVDAPRVSAFKTWFDADIAESGGLGGRRFYNTPGGVMAAAGQLLLWLLIALICAASAYNKWVAGSTSTAVVIGFALAAWIAGVLLSLRRKTFKAGSVLIIAVVVLLAIAWSF